MTQNFLDMLHIDRTSDLKSTPTSSFLKVLSSPRVAKSHNPVVKISVNLLKYNLANYVYAALSLVEIFRRFKTGLNCPESISFPKK